MSVILVDNLSFGYDGACENIFENVDIRLDTSWRLGLTGRNGRGKTTFLRLLTGELEYSGSITASVDFYRFPYHPEDESLSGDEIIRKICKGRDDWEISCELSMIGLSEEVTARPFCTLSGGERTKLLLAAMFLAENRFLLIDEPTDNLDSETREAVGEYLSAKNGFILVSHDRALLDRCTDHIMSINRNSITVTKGNYSVWEHEKELSDSRELEENRRLRKEIGRLTDAAKRTSEWADRSERKKIGFDPTKTEKSLTRRAYEGAKSKKAMARAKAFEDRSLKAAEEKSKLLKEIEKADTISISPLKFHSNVILEAEDFGLSYGDMELFAGAELTLRQGEAIALCGKNGCGKSTLLRYICGERDGVTASGRLILPSGVIISYAPQNADHLKGTLSEYAEKTSVDLTLFLTILRKLDFGREQFAKRLEDMSAGQRKKALLAGSLASKAHLYAWDEPLNFIDVISRRQIEELITSCRPTLLFAEHDEMFRKNVGAVEIWLDR
ncbi:MAG: ATP-binding cassette domain-containing protein [Oscillospiraceae bacterium]|nr:ATP-binding cassette domain-containing protein [Oscillospiraceae bacterium]